uniref:Ig-like domain-containing protein n=1 Tax=Ornithorhynchus anatinus TaxID=9258 RepID=A0A6I8N4H2_ORNAN
MAPGPVWLVAVCVLGAAPASAFCLLSPSLAGPTVAGVAQTPRHLVTGRDQNVILSCKPISGHRSVYWYRQQAGREPQLLTYFEDSAELDRSGMPNERFSAQTQDSSSKLSVQHAEPGDSARYFCASSSSTAMGLRPCPTHKPPARTKGGGEGDQDLSYSHEATKPWATSPSPLCRGAACGERRRGRPDH